MGLVMPSSLFCGCCVRCCGDLKRFTMIENEKSFRTGWKKILILIGVVRKIHQIDVGGMKMPIFPPGKFCSVTSSTCLWITLLLLGFWNLWSQNLLSLHSHVVEQLRESWNVTQNHQPDKDIRIKTPVDLIWHIIGEWSVLLVIGQSEKDQSQFTTDTQWVQDVEQCVTQVH